MKTRIRAAAVLISKFCVTTLAKRLNLVHLRPLLVGRQIALRQNAAKTQYQTRTRVVALLVISKICVPTLTKRLNLVQLRLLLVRRQIALRQNAAMRPHQTLQTKNQKPQGLPMCGQIQPVRLALSHAELSPATLNCTRELHAKRAQENKLNVLMKL
jgi:hypothetical protein